MIAKQLPQFLALLLIIIVFSSCHSLRSLTSRDGSGTAKATKKKAARDLKFLEHIEMQPGAVVTSKHKTSGLKKPLAAYHYNDMQNTNMEEVNWLQFKYAIISDAEVETFNNIPLLKKIDEWWGTKYCMGGESKSCIDCSGFSSTIFKDVYNMMLPRTAQDQYNSCDKVVVEDLKEGDLVFFKTYSRGVSHVGIYIANNKFVHASSSEGVTISDLNDAYWQPRYIGAGRVRRS